VSQQNKDVLMFKPEKNSASSSMTTTLPATFKKYLLAMSGIAFVAVLIAFDQTVVSTALPTIVAELKGLEFYSWVATAYLLTSVVTVPIFARLGDYFGRRIFTLWAIVVFTSASALCGYADSILFLVLARAVQGIGGGMLSATAFASIADLFPDTRKRLQWAVIISSSFGIANALGPSIGGLLTHYYSWRAVFYVNLPVGILSFCLVWVFMPVIRNNKTPQHNQLDWRGAILLSLALGSLQLFIEFIPAHDISITTLLLITISVFSFYGLFYWEKKIQDPILPLQLFYTKGVIEIFYLALLLGVVMFALLFYMPLLLQAGFNMAAHEAGILITPLVVCMTFASIINSRSVVKMKIPNHMLILGFVLLVSACTGVILTTPHTSHLAILSYMALGGLGLGFVSPNLSIFVQQLIERKNLGIATGLIQSFRLIGGMLGTGIIGSIINHLYKHKITKALQIEHLELWLPKFLDPKVLLTKTHGDAAFLQQTFAGISHKNLDLLMTTAREALIDSVQIGISFAAVIILLAFYLIQRIPVISLDKLPENASK